MTIGERIKKVRKELNLTQQDFAERIGATQNTMTRYENGKINPSSAAITLICRTFHVNETWLREGTGPMLTQPTGSVEQVREWVNGIFEKGSYFEQSFIKSRSCFTDKEWNLMEKFIDMLVEDQKAREASALASPAPKGPLPFTPEELAAYEKVKAIMEREADTQAPDDSITTVEQKRAIMEQELAAEAAAEGKLPASTGSNGLKSTDIA